MWILYTAHRNIYIYICSISICIISDSTWQQLAAKYQLGFGWSCGYILIWYFQHLSPIRLPSGSHDMESGSRFDDPGMLIECNKGLLKTPQVEFETNLCVRTFCLVSTHLWIHLLLQKLSNTSLNQSCDQSSNLYQPLKNSDLVT